MAFHRRLLGFQAVSEASPGCSVGLRGLMGASLNSRSLPWGLREFQMRFMGFQGVLWIMGVFHEVSDMFRGFEGVPGVFHGVSGYSVSVSGKKKFQKCFKLL